MRVIYLWLVIIFSLSELGFSQTGDIKIGSSTVDRYPHGGYFDFSEPDAVNIKVSVWGYVRFPGKYLLPSYANIRDLLSYAGGPTDDALLEDIKLYKITNDTTRITVPVNYKNLMGFDDNNTRLTKVPDLTVGDVLYVPGKPKLYFRDYFSMTLQVVTTLTSLTILVLNIIRN